MVNMHYEAWQFLTQFQTEAHLNILDLGGRDLNTSQQGYHLADLWPNAYILVLDKQTGPNVDIVADARNWQPRGKYDLVLCTEVLEHVRGWHHIIVTARLAIEETGRFLLTCAGPGRAEHSGISDGPLQVGEWYQNIDPAELIDIMRWNQFEPTINSLQAHGQHDIQVIGIPK